MFKRIALLAFFSVAISQFGGCQPEEKKDAEKRPRPVMVSELSKKQPPSDSLVAASVGAWKTEEIGFEVNGRVEFAAEPNTFIERRIKNNKGMSISKGTPIAKLEDERYKLQVEKAKADVSRAKLNLSAAQTELNESIPAQISAAVASRDLAKTTFDRSSELFSQRAMSKSEVDRDKANYESSISQVKQLEATQKTKAAEIKSLENAIQQAELNYRDAQRNLEDCVLYSAFQGQIADVKVVPGSVVSAGTPVATLQMMDPIKVELEVSAAKSRELNRRDILPVQIQMPDGSVKTEEGFLYLIDPVADPQTRTFTLTLLVMNGKIPLQTTAKNVAVTNDLWRLDYKFLPGSSKDTLFVDQRALLKDDSGFYLWQVSNATIQDRPAGMKEFKVRKLRVRLGEKKIPYLGNWIFQQIHVKGNEFDPNSHFIVGQIKVKNGTPETWNGDTVYLDPGDRWTLRPGDLVRVDLSGKLAPAGFYVPMNSIVRKAEKSYIFVAENNESGQTVAKRLEVKLVDSKFNNQTSSFRSIESVDGRPLEGLQFVIEGAHYIVDGEPIKVVPSAGAPKGN